MPRRRCTGCGRVAPKPELVRLAIDREQRRAVIDVRGTLPGRGGYVCRDATPGSPNADCLSLALRRGGLARALRAAVKIDPEHPELVESTCQ
ncbi:MAG TPA: YlxR family protein [Solirubrobacteraceae bacterium]|nr:YlxR family protein [Solirubrobacteraceae bacterium]